MVTENLMKDMNIIMANNKKLRDKIDKIKEYLEKHEMLEDGTIIYKFNKYVASSNPHFLDKLIEIIEE